MFIRIKKRKITSSPDRIPDYSYRFMIVKSYRQKGQPRQKVIKYLGSARQSDLKDSGKKKKILLEMTKRLEAVDLNAREIASLKLNLISKIFHLR